MVYKPTFPARNGGTERGQADGFDLETLTKLDSVKDNVPWMIEIFMGKWSGFHGRYYIMYILYIYIYIHVYTYICIYIYMGFRI